MQVLIIEDDHVLGPALHDFLTAQSYNVQLMAHGDQLLTRLEQQTFDLLVLDLNLPGLSGLELLRQLRQMGHEMSVLILTARDALEDRVAGLDAGADDYITKPFELAELAARMRALIRRQHNKFSHILEFGSLQLDTLHRELLFKKQCIKVSVRELSLLELLMQRAGKIVTKQQIIHSLSANNVGFSDNAVEVYVYRLRKRLEHTGVIIHTVHGFGYRLDLNDRTPKKS